MKTIPHNRSCCTAVWGFRVSPASTPTIPGSYIRHLSLLVLKQFLRAQLHMSRPKQSMGYQSLASSRQHEKEQLDIAFRLSSKFCH